MSAKRFSPIGSSVDQHAYYSAFYYEVKQLPNFYNRYHHDSILVFFVCVQSEGKSPLLGNTRKLLNLKTSFCLNLDVLKLRK